MDVFCHHIYEYKKGLRNLVLYTAPRSERGTVEERIEKESLAYLVCENGENKINVFFGNPVCIDVVKSFDVCSLSELSDEQDFLLGVMLGYDRLKQCERYLVRKSHKTRVEDLIG